MSTSGVYTFTLNQTQIITYAFNELNMYMGQTPTQADYQFALYKLNGMLKVWETEDLKLWIRKQATLFPAYNTTSFSLGPSGDHCTNTYVATTLSAAAASSATTITCTTVTGMSTSDNIGIELDDGTRQWTTITNINTGTKVVTLNAALTSAAAATNTVITYTTKIQRPLRIIRATTLDLKSNNTEVQCKRESFDNYFNLPNKTTAGRPNIFYYDKTLTNGTIYLYPDPSKVYQLFKFTYHEALQDMVNTTDNVEDPQEWLYPIVINLAAILARPYGKIVEAPAIQAEADALKLTLRSFDADEEDLQIVRDTRYQPR